VVDYEHLDPTDEDSALDFIKQRRDFIDGVVVTGGEPMVNGEVIGFLERLKGTGLSIKLDTNGYNTDILMEILKGRLVDYVAMDIKTSLEKYSVASGRIVNTERTVESIRAIMAAPIEYEFRTTCVPRLVERQDVEEIALLIRGAKRYVLQQFSCEVTLDPSYMKISPHPREKLEEFRNLAQRYVKVVRIRGI
jgi:pyruvate formate lyase activating enzyme